MKKQQLFLGVTFILIAASAFCEASEVKEVSPEVVFSGSSGIDQKGGYFGTGVLIEAGSNDSKISATLTLPQYKNTSSTIAKDFWTFKLSAPIDKKSNRTDLITDSGFGADYSASLGYSKVFGNVNIHTLTDDDAIKFFEKASSRCLKNPPNNDTKQCEKYQSIGDFIDTTYLTATEKSKVLGDLKWEKPIFFLGVDGSVGKQSLSYLSSDDFKSTNASRTPYSLSAFGGITPNSSAFYLGGGFEYKVKYKNVDSQTLCAAQVDSDPIECFTGAFSAPVKNEDKTIFGLARVQKSIKVGKQEFPIGVEVKVAYDAEDKVFGIEAPIYLFADEKKNLTSGVRLSWDDDDSDLGIGIFIGSSFGLLAPN